MKKKMFSVRYKDEKAFDDIKDIAFDIGHFYQAQNDFLDCFGDPGVLKKPGTDIEDGKCTWQAALTIETLGNDRQKGIMKECYGKKGRIFTLRRSNRYQNPNDFCSLLQTSSALPKSKRYTMN